MMLPMVLPLPRTSASLGAGVGCFLAQAGSASIVSGGSAGGFPSKVTVPVTVEAAKATPGEIENATTAAATNPKVFPIQRILGSLIKLVIAKLRSPRRRLSSAKIVRIGRLY